MSKESLLRQVPLFAGLPPAELRRCTSLVQEREYLKGRVIFQADDPSSVLFILKSGAVKIALCDPNGRETIVKLLYPPDFFGEMSLLDGRFHSATITAVEKSVAFMLPREAFIRLIQKYPAFALVIMKALSARVRETNKTIASFVFNNAYGKVGRVLLELARAREAKSLHGMVVPLHLSRQELADYAGVSRVTLHRVLTELAKIRCLAMGKRRITILNEAGLTKD